MVLHGLLGSARNLATLVRGLAEADPRLGVVALDLPGHGASPSLPPDADAATLAREVLDTARALGLTPPLALVGHSLGGRVALAAARLAPAAVGHVTLLDIAPGPIEPGGEVGRVLEVLLAAPAVVASQAEGRAALVGAGLAPALADWLLLNLEPAEGSFRWRVDRAALADLHARVAAEDLWPVVEGRRRFTLRCVRGGGSRYVTDADVRRLDAAGCPVATLAGAGHFLHADRPREVLAAVLGGLAVD